MNARSTCFTKLFSCPLIVAIKRWLHIKICHRWSGSSSRQQDPFSFFYPLNFTSCFNKVKTSWEDHEGATGCWDRIIDKLSCLKTWVRLLSQLTCTMYVAQRLWLHWNSKDGITKEIKHSVPYTFEWSIPCLKLRKYHSVLYSTPQERMYCIV